MLHPKSLIYLLVSTSVVVALATGGGYFLENRSMSANPQDDCSVSSECTKEKSLSPPGNATLSTVPSPSSPSTSSSFSGVSSSSSLLSNLAGTSIKSSEIAKKSIPFTFIIHSEFTEGKKKSHHINIDLANYRSSAITGKDLVREIKFSDWGKALSFFSLRMNKKTLVEYYHSIDDQLSQQKKRNIVGDPDAKKRNIVGLNGYVILPSFPVNFWDSSSATDLVIPNATPVSSDEGAEHSSGRRILTISANGGDIFESDERFDVCMRFLGRFLDRNLGGEMQACDFDTVLAWGISVERGLDSNVMEIELVVDW